MTDINFTLEIAQALYASEEEFPVDFEFGWQWIGYTQKKNAIKKLESHFQKGVDYIELTALPLGKAKAGGQNRLDLRLTLDCFKSFAMMAGTEKGKEVRKYFLQCERIAKDLIKKQSEMTPIQSLLIAVQQMAEQERRLLEQQRKQEEMDRLLAQTQEGQKQINDNVANLDNRTSDVESRTDNLEQRVDSLNGSNTGYISVRCYCKEHKIKLPLNTAKETGKLAAKLCRTRRIPIGSLKDEMFGSVGTYPYEIIEEAIAIAQA